MPLYQFKCPKCGEEFTEFQGMHQDHKAPCECGAVADRVWTPATTVVAFRSGWDEGLGQNFYTKKERDDYCREKGYTRITD